MKLKTCTFILLLWLVGCASSVSPQVTDESPSLPATAFPPTITPTTPPTAILPLDTATPTAPPPSPTAIPTMTIPAETLSHLQGATALAPLTPGSGQITAYLSHNLPDVGRIPANVEAWFIYEAKIVSVTVPIPPEWLVIEWPVDPASFSPIFYSASIMPVAYTNVEKYGYQAPSIDLAVYRAGLITSLIDWFHLYSTTDVFGSEQCSDKAFWCGVTTVEETMVDTSIALTFTHNAMDISIYTTIFNVNGIIVALSFTHKGIIPFEPVYEIMLSDVQIK